MTNPDITEPNAQQNTQTHQGVLLGVQCLVLGVWACGPRNTQTPDPDTQQDTLMSLGVLLGVWLCDVWVAHVVVAFSRVLLGRRVFFFTCRSRHGGGAAGRLDVGCHVPQS